MSDDEFYGLFTQNNTYDDSSSLFADGNVGRQLQHQPLQTIDVKAREDVAELRGLVGALERRIANLEQEHNQERMRDQLRAVDSQSNAIGATTSTATTSSKRPRTSSSVSTSTSSASASTPLVFEYGGKKSLRCLLCDVPIEPHGSKSGFRASDHVKSEMHARNLLNKPLLHCAMKCPGRNHDSTYTTQFPVVETGAPQGLALDAKAKVALMERCATYGAGELYACTKCGGRIDKTFYDEAKSSQEGDRAGAVRVSTWSAANESEQGYAPGAYYVFNDGGESVVQRTPPPPSHSGAIEIAFMPVTQRIQGRVVHFDASADHVLGRTHLPLTEIGNIDAFAFVPQELAIAFPALQEQLVDGRVQLCVGRDDGWLVAKRADVDLFAPTCVDHLQAVLNIGQCVRVSSIHAFDEANPHFYINSTPIAVRDVDDVYAALKRWPTASQCPLGYKPVVISVYFMSRQVLHALPELEATTMATFESVMMAKVLERGALKQLVTRLIQLDRDGELLRIVASTKASLQQLLPVISGVFATVRANVAPRCGHLLAMLACQQNDVSALRQLADAVDDRDDLLWLDALITQKFAEKRVEVLLALISMARQSSMVHRAACDALRLNLHPVIDACLSHRVFRLSDLSDGHCRQLLQHATITGNVDVVRRLLRTDKRFARLALAPPSPCALELALQYDRADVFDLMMHLDPELMAAALQRFADAASSWESSMLGIAVKRHSEVMVERLVKLGYISERHIEPALVCAARGGQSRAVLALLGVLRGATTKLPQEYFDCAVANCDANVVGEILRRFGAHIDVMRAHDEQHVPALIVAACRDMPDMIDVLAARIVGDEQRDPRVTVLQGALTVAVWRGCRQAVRHLLLNVASTPKLVIPAKSLTGKCDGAMFRELLQMVGIDRFDCDAAGLLRSLVADYTPMHTNDPERWQRVLALFEYAKDLSASIGPIGFDDAPVIGLGSRRVRDWTRQPAANHVLYCAVGANEPQLASLLLARQPVVELGNDVALAVLAQAIRHNHVDVIQRILSNDSLDTSRRAFDDASPALLIRREPLQPLAIEVAADYARYDVLERLMARREFKPSVDNNALLRALCGVDGIVLAYCASTERAMIQYGLLCEPLSFRRINVQHDANRILTLIHRLLADERFEAAGAPCNALSTILLAVCGQERLRRARQMRGAQMVAESPSETSEERYCVNHVPRQNRGGVSQAQLVRALLSHALCDPNVVLIDRYQQPDGQVVALLKNDPRYCVDVVDDAFGGLQRQ